MDPNAPLDPAAGGRPEDAVVPDPHAGEALPEPQDGRRPEAIAADVRPEQDEPGGPLAGLVTAASAQVAEEAAPDGSGEAEAVLEQMGVEQEGIESGQLLGFVVATLVAVGLLAVILIYLIYAPFRSNTGVVASNVELYPELQQSRVDGRAKLDQGTRTGDVYTVPIGRAMSLVAAEYGADSAAAAPRLSRADFNTLMVNRTEGRAVQSGVARRDSVARGAGTTNEEVGVDAGENAPAVVTEDATPITTN